MRFTVAAVTGGVLLVLLLAPGASASHCIVGNTGADQVHLSDGRCGYLVEVVNASVPVTGPLTDAQLRAAGVPVLGPLTDAELRMAAVPVSGPLTDTQLRAERVPVSIEAQPQIEAVWADEDRARVDDFRTDVTHGLGVLMFTAGFGTVMWMRSKQ